MIPLSLCYSIQSNGSLNLNQIIYKRGSLNFNISIKDECFFLHSKNSKLKKNPHRFNFDTSVSQKMSLNGFSDEDSLQYENISKDGGVLKNIIKKGYGPLIQNGFQVKLNYQGKLSDGRVFDSSLTRKKPFSVVIGEQKVISGWEIGIKSMKMGEKAKFFISSKYGYKKKGIPPIIPPNADLFFEIEIIDVIEKIETDTKKMSLNQTQEVLLSSELVQKKNESDYTYSSDKFFFISPFSSQTGEKAPWWLNPNITFFLIFLIIIILFTLVYSLGGINNSFDNPSSILDSGDYI
jgi:FKBP-type peptidyl-prolyl cis-trans isomerase